MHRLSMTLLGLMGGLTLIASLISAYAAYVPRRGDGPPSAEEAALRARRGTAAAYAASYSTLLLFVVLGPYKRAEPWSFWAIGTGSLVLVVLNVLRIPLLGTLSGTGPAAAQFGLVALGILLGLPRLRARAAG